MLTSEYNDDLKKAFEAIDKSFFDGVQEHALPPVLLSFARIQNAQCTGRTYVNLLEDTKGKYGDKRIQFIELSTVWLDRKKKEILATIMHELAHAYEVAYVKVPRNGYHTKTWQKLMEDVDLEVIFHNSSRTSAEVKSITGGIFDKFADKFLSDNPDWLTVYEEKKERVASKLKTKTSRKTKYVCRCGNKVWGKSGLIIHCPECEHSYDEE